MKNLLDGGSRRSPTIFDILVAQYMLISSKRTRFGKGTLSFCALLVFWQGNVGTTLVL